jgi:lipopolysaccharide transport system ATP-binding protein
VERYSSGMTVRLAFAVAAHLEPEILVVDEVLAVGDAAFQKKCLGKMEDVSRCGRTVLFVSHNMGMIGALCSKVILIRKGMVALEGVPEIVVNEYLDAGFEGKEGRNGSGCSIDYGLIKNQKPGTILLEDVSLEGPETNSSLIKTGDDISLKILYTAKSHINNLAFVVSFKNYIGQEVVRLSTMPISGFQIEKLFDKGVLVLKINKLPLVAGRYYLSLGIVRERLEWLVNLEDLLTFDVHLRDVYGSGFPLDSSRGIIVVDHGWSHYGG